MGEHDLLCPQHYVQRGLRDAAGNHAERSCQCDLIADVGERIATAIEAQVAVPDTGVIAVRWAARIARSGGRDD